MPRRIEVELIGDSRSLERAFSKSARSAQGWNKDMTKSARTSRSVFKSIGSAAKYGAAGLGIAGFAGAAKLAFDEMAEAEKVGAQTAAVLESTGQAANVSAKQVDQYATSLLNMSGVDDEAIKSGENLLLTFTNIRNEAGKGNDIFKQATATMLDMSVALGQDATTSAIQLGKALNDPIKGVSALRRVGVSFSADQIKLIKTLVATGDTLGAQKVILAELRKEFGGSAKAAGETLSGKLNILRETAVNLGAEIATVLTPSVKAAADRMTKWLQNTDNQKQVLADTAAVAHATAEGIKAFVEIVKVAVTVTRALTGSVEAMNSALDKVNLGFLHKGILKWDRSGGLLGKLGVPGFGGGGGGAPAPRTPVKPAGVWGAPTTVINGDVHVNGVQNVRQFQNEMTKQARGRPAGRRGAR